MTEPGYRILGPIASGGMGAVSLALRTDRSGGSAPIAVKRLHANRADDPESVAMFLDEARIASKLVHPNVVRIRDVEMLGEELVIVMDYVEGASLTQLLRTLRDANASLPVPVACRIVHDALLGLHAAHELKDINGTALGIVHRDVSPHNLIVGSDGLTRVADFGIAIASGRLASTRSEVQVKGKLRYLSPEQIYRKGIDRRVDVFAAGIVLWEALTGKKLFAGDTESETLAMILREPIAPPSSVQMEVPLEVDELCLRALERDPARRFSTAAELAEALAPFVAPREEVAALVEKYEGAGFAERRALLEQGARDEEATPRHADDDTWITTAARPKKRRVREAIAGAALLVGALVGACGAKLTGTTPEPVVVTPAAAALESATANGNANANGLGSGDATNANATTKVSPAEAATVAVDLDNDAAVLAAVAQGDVSEAPAAGSARSGVRGAPPTPQKARTRGAAATGKRSPSRPFMPNDL